MGSAQNLCCIVWDLSLWYRDSLVVAHGLSSCGMIVTCPQACEILVPGGGIEPAPSALQGGFLTTRPPGKSPTLLVGRSKDATIIVKISPS